jgi:hypothetical protein
VPGVTPTFTVTDTDGTPDAALGPISCTPSNNDGISNCSYTRSTTTTDTISIWVNQSNGLSGNREGIGGCTTTPPGVVCEPGENITKNYIAAQTGRTIDLTCSGAAYAPTSPEDCVQRVNDTTTDFTASVANSNTALATTTNGTLVGFTVTGGSGDETAVPAECTTAGGAAVAPGTSTCNTVITDPTPVSGEVLTVTATIRGTAVSDSGTVTYFSDFVDARNITITPKTATTAPGGLRTFTVKVVDSQGNGVPNVQVNVTESGPGTFRDNSSNVNVTTDKTGQATVEVTSLPSESGAQTLTASINFAGFTQCGQAAGTGSKPQGGAVPANQTAGNCTDTATNTWGAVSPSPSTSPSGGGRAALTLVVNTPTVPAGSTGRLTATGAANEAYQLMCYSRPSTTYVVARSGSFNATGDPVTFTLSLGRNTRCFIQYATTPAQGASGSVVINVTTVLSLSTVRTGVRTYIFQGRNLPRVAGQLITLYRVDGSGNEIRTSNLVTDNSGIYRVTRTFTGTGTFRFKVRTSQTLNNAAGVSNTITVRVF